MTYRVRIREENCQNNSFESQFDFTQDCIWGKVLTEEGWHGLFCLENAGGSSRQSSLDALVKQSFAFTHFPSALEPWHHRTDQKPSDGLLFVLPAVSGQFMWNEMVVRPAGSSRVTSLVEQAPARYLASKRRRRCERSKF